MKIPHNPNNPIDISVEGLVREVSKAGTKSRVISEIPFPKNIENGIEGFQIPSIDDKDLPMILGVIFGQMEHLEGVINSIYQKSEVEFYKSYKETEAYKKNSLSVYKFTTAEMIRKAVSIVNHDISNRSDKNIKKLIQKGFKTVYNYIEKGENSGHSMMIDDIEVIFFDYLLETLANSYEKNKKRDKKLPEDFYVTSSVIMAIYLADTRGNCALVTLVEKNLEVATSKIQDLYFLQSENIWRDDFLGETEERKLEIEAIEKEFNISKKFSSVADIVEDIIWSFKVEGQEFPPDRTSDILCADKNYLLFYGLKGSELLRNTSINRKEFNNFLRLTLNVYDIKSSIGSYSLSNYEKKIQKAEMIVNQLIVFSIMKEYNELRVVAAKNTKEENLIISEAKDKELSELVNKMNDNNIEKEDEIKALKDELRRTQDIIEKLESKNKKLQEDLSKTENNKKELVAIRNFLFSLEQEDLQGEGLTTNEALKVIKDIDGVLISGNNNWITKMKELLPNWKFINSKNLNSDLSVLDNVDKVFFSSLSSSHAFYYKLMSQMRANDTDLVYLSPSTNTDKIVKEIYSSLQGFL